MISRMRTALSSTLRLARANSSHTLAGRRLRRCSSRDGKVDEEGIVRLGSILHDSRPAGMPRALPELERHMEAEYH